MPAVIDGPRSPLFTPLPIDGNFSFNDTVDASLQDRMKRSLLDAPRGSCVCWGIDIQDFWVTFLRVVTALNTAIHRKLSVRRGQSASNATQCLGEKECKLNATLLPAGLGLF